MSTARRPLAALTAGLIGLALFGTAPALAAEPAPDGPRLRVVVVTDGAHEAARVALDLSDLTDQGLTVVDAAPAGRTVTVEVPAASVAGLVAEVEERADVAEVVPETTYSLFDVPDDAQWVAQSTSLDALRLPEAWDITHATGSVVIGVVDSGVMVAHPDLDGKIVGTYNAATGGTSVVDDIGHGTMVASMAAAETDNGIGVAASGWDASILAVKVADSDRVITNAALADGIDWAVDHGADVINLSLGSLTNDPAVSGAVERAVSADVVVVAAAGNSGTSAKFYPAALSDVLAVGATTAGGGSRAGFSQYGSWVDVGAPGVSIVGANASFVDEPDYVEGDGTSFASPLVAGIAALVRSSRPDLDEAGVRSAITATTTSKSYGFAGGLVDAYAALGHALVLPGPVIVSPTAGASVSGTVEVQALLPGGVVADHVQARLVGGGPVVVAPIDPDTGSATLDLPTFGSDGPETLRLVLCRATLCSPTGTDRALDVENDAPTLTSPSDGAAIVSAFDVTADAPGPAVRFVADGTTLLSTDLTSPFGVTVGIGELAAGPHTLTAVVCDAAGTTCASDDPSDPVDITVARLSPVIDSLAPLPFSPDGDGRRDETTLGYTLDVDSDVTLSILRADGSPFYVRHVGSQVAGAHTWTWRGKDAAGTVVKSGTYTLRLDTAATVSTELLLGQVSHALPIDKVNPTLTKRSSTYPTVYPVNDDYRDKTVLSVTVSEPTRSLRTTVYNSSGKAVWSTTVADAPAGQVSATFKGRTASGDRLPSGTYTYAFRANDYAGNVTTSSRGTVKVSGKRLSAAKTATKTLTAKASFDVWGNDDECSALYLSSWAPGALKWDSCPGGSVVSWHHVTLPDKAVYGTVRVSTYARGSSGSSAYCAYVDDDDTYQSESRFDDDTETHRAARVPLTADLLKGHKLRWAMLVEDGDTYSAQTFTVTWTYYELV